MWNRTGLYFAVIISCLMHGIFIALSGGLYVPRLVREKWPIEIEIIESTEKVDIEEKIEVKEKKLEPIKKVPLKVTHTDIASLPKISKAPLLKEVVPEKPSPKCGTVFLVDASESMVISLDTAKKILLDRLNNLSQKELINIACFSNKVNFFSQKPLILTKNVKEKAVSFCGGIEAQGSLDVAIGLKEALKSNPSKIILISDGIAEDKKLADELIRKAKKRGVIIDTILIKRKPFEEEVLKKAAYLTGGNFSIH